MAAERQGYIRISQQDGSVLQDSLTGDILFYTSDASQRILLGSKDRVSSLVVSSDSVNFTGPMVLTHGPLSNADLETVNSSFWNKTASNDLFYDGGRVGVGTSFPRVSLQVLSTEAIGFPAGTTAQRPANPLEGYMRFNTETKDFEGFSSNAWTSVARDALALPDLTSKLSSTSNFSYENLESQSNYSYGTLANSLFAVSNYAYVNLTVFPTALSNYAYSNLATQVQSASNAAGTALSRNGGGTVTGELVVATAGGISNLVVNSNGARLMALDLQNQETGTNKWSFRATSNSNVSIGFSINNNSPTNVLTIRPDNAVLASGPILNSNDGFFLYGYNGTTYNALSTDGTGVMYRNGTVQYNLNARFDASTGTFTAGHPGRYFVHASLLAAAGTSRLEYKVSFSTGFDVPASTAAVTAEPAVCAFVVYLPAGAAIRCIKTSGTAQADPRNDHYFGVYFVG